MSNFEFVFHGADFTPLFRSVNGNKKSCFGFSYNSEKKPTKAQTEIINSEAKQTELLMAFLEKAQANIDNLIVGDKLQSRLFRCLR